MIVDDVENHLDPVSVKLIDHGLEFVRERRFEITRLRCEEGNGIVPPIVAQPLLDQVTVVDEGVDGQQLCAGNAKRAQVGRNVRMRQARESPAICFGYQRMQLGKALNVHLVGDRALPGDFRLARYAPGESRVDDSALLHQGRAVAFVIGEVLVGMVELIAEQLRSPAQLADQLLRIRIKDQLVGVEAMPGIRFIRPVDTVSVNGPGAG